MVVRQPGDVVANRMDAGGSDLAAQINGGEQHVAGLATSATLVAGLQIIENGGVASVTQIFAGEQDIAAGGVAFGVINFTGMQVAETGGAAVGAVVIDGSQDIFGSAIGTAVGSGVQFIEAGGLASETVLLSPAAVQVMEVIAGGAAAKAGMAKGDVLLEFAGEEVFTVDDLHRLLTAELAGRDAEAKVLRSGGPRDLTLRADLDE